MLIGPLAMQENPLVLALGHVHNNCAPSLTASQPGAASHAGHACQPPDNERGQSTQPQVVVRMSTAMTSPALATSLRAMAS